MIPITRLTTRPAARLAPRAGATLFLLAAWAMPAIAQDKDTIQLKDGKSETGVVKTEEYAGVSFDPAKGSARTIEWKEIAPNGITYGDSPEFQSAKDALDGGKFEEALPKLEELLSDAKLRPVLKQNAQYLLATIYQRQGEFDKAIEAYKKVIADFPKSRWLMEIGENLVASYAGKKDIASAGKALDELSAAASSAGVESGFNSAVNVLKGRLFEEQGKFTEANAAYGVAEKASGVAANVVQQARLGQGRCMVALNKKTEAETLFRNLTKEDAPNAVLAGAWNGLADLTLEEGRKAPGDPEKLIDALFQYLRGVVQYGPLPGEPVAEYKRALKGAAQTCEFIAQLEKNADRKRLYAERAREHKAQLQKEFPSGALQVPDPTPDLSPSKKVDEKK